MMLCEKDDVALAGLIVKLYNYSVREDADLDEVSRLADEIEEASANLYGGENELDMVDVPIELFHRMAAEVEHHKTMLAGAGAGIVLTLGASTTGKAEYGIAKDLEITERIRIRATEGEELTDSEIDKIVDCAVEGFRATLVRESNALKAEILEIKNKVSTPN